MDGPHDPAYDGIEEFIDDPRSRVIRTGRANGAAEARNIGTRAASGEWIAFLDDDDVFLPQKLERQLGAIEDAGLRELGRPILSTTAVIAVHEGRVERWPGRAPLPGEPVENFLFGLGAKPTNHRVLSTCTLLVSHDLALAVPMRGRSFDDWDWQIRAVEGCNAPITSRRR